MLQKGFSELQPVFYPIRADSRTLAEQRKIRRSLLSDISSTGTIKVLKSNINIPEEIRVEILSDFIVLQKSTQFKRELTYNYMKVTSNKNIIYINTPSVQLEAQTPDALNFKRQIDYLIDANNGTREFTINRDVSMVKIAIIYRT